MAKRRKPEEAAKPSPDQGQASSDSPNELDEIIEAEVVDAAPEAEGRPGELVPAQPRRDSLARYDALQAYMRDVHRYPLLSPEEEREQALKVYEEGDVEAAKRLATGNLRLVVKIAYEYRRAHKNILDLIQEGNIGLVQAVMKYDPYKGVKLSTYAAWWIRAYILRFILNNARLVKVGTTQAQRKLFFNLKKEKARLAAMGIEASPDVIAKRLDVPTEEVVQMDRRLAAGDMSLDVPVGAEDSRQTRMDLLPAGSGPIDDILADEQVGSIVRGKLDAFGKTLSGKDRKIFYQRLLAEDPRTLQDLGEEFGVSRERVRQLEKRLQDKLREYLKSEVGEDVLGL